MEIRSSNAARDREDVEVECRVHFCEEIHPTYTHFISDFVHPGITHDGIWWSKLSWPHIQVFKLILGIVDERLSMQPDWDVPS